MAEGHSSRYLKIRNEFKRIVKERPNNFWTDKAYEVHGGERTIDYAQEVDEVFVLPFEIIKPI